MQSFFEETPNRIILRIKVIPRAKETKIVGMHGDRLKIRLAAPPIDGQANAELLRFLREKLGLSKTQVSILRGEKSQLKDVLCVGTNLKSVQNLARFDDQIEMFD